MHTLVISDEYTLRPKGKGGGDAKPGPTLLMVIAWFMLANGFLPKAKEKLIHEKYHEEFLKDFSTKNKTEYGLYFEYISSLCMIDFITTDVYAAMS